MLLARHRALTLSAALAAGCSNEPRPREVLRIDGLSPGGELGFRFGDARDVDGDGVLDIVAGARHGGAQRSGEAGVWSGGALVRHWESTDTDALFGHVARAVPDLDGDATPDIVISAPNAVVASIPTGYVEAYSGRSGMRLWRAVGSGYDGFGWHVEHTDDLDGDNVVDLWVGAPSDPIAGRVYLVAGRTGSIVRVIDGPADAQFGWYLAPVADVDGDGARDVAIGAPTALVAGGRRGAVHVTSATGAELRVLQGELFGHKFGEMLASLDDLDGDGIGELAISAVGEPLGTTTIASEVAVVSAATGERLHLLTETTPGELYGRMLAATADLDGDGRRELAVAAPWWNGRHGRLEVRSTATWRVLAHLEGAENGWLGWHVANADDDSILVSQLHAGADRGAVLLYELR